MGKKIVILFAKEDAEEFVARLRDDLQKIGSNGTVDIDDIYCGDEYYREIDKNSHLPLAVVILLTPEALRLFQIKKAWNDAVNHNLPVIPLLVKECPIPRALDAFSLLDFQENYEKPFSILSERLKNLYSEHITFLKLRLNEYESTTHFASNRERHQSTIESLKLTISQWETYSKQGQTATQDDTRQVDRHDQSESQARQKIDDEKIQADVGKPGQISSYPQLPINSNANTNQGTKKTVLVVDDEIGALTLIGIMLERGGFHVLKEKDAKSALDILDQNKPDVIILDIMMPGMDGIKLCHLIRQRENFKQTPILILGARGDAESVMRGFEAGATDYLPKPILHHDLVTKVQSMLLEPRPQLSDEGKVRHETESTSNLFNKQRLWPRVLRYLIRKTRLFISSIRSVFLNASAAPLSTRDPFHKR